ncbi:MAG: hypothetical protein OEZ06_15045 [Myxococcales bacterium]|nr:hypothetical protein [Myxococcales bacterium]
MTEKETTEATTEAVTEAATEAATKYAAAPDPLAFTRERLLEIGGVWSDFAKQRAGDYARAYKSKLLSPLQHYLAMKNKAKAT